MVGLIAFGSLVRRYIMTGACVGGSYSPHNSQEAKRARKGLLSPVRAYLQ